MADYTETVTLSDVKVGDRWVGISAIGPVTINEEKPGPNLTRVVMNFRLGQSTYTLDSDDDEIEITDADGWECSIAAQDTFLPRAGAWAWDMEFYPEGYASPWTLYAGTLRVWDDVD